jgi:organic hydroperoxide reductase OsmC/OhrA
VTTKIGSVAKNILTTFYSGNESAFATISCVVTDFLQQSQNSEGKTAITRITLRPKIEFSVDRAPSAEELQSLHNSAHDECFIANSLKSEIVVEAD